MPLALLADGNGLTRQDETDRQDLIEAFEEAMNEAQSLSTKLQTLERQIAAFSDAKDPASSPKPKKFIETVQNDHRSRQEQQVAQQPAPNEQLPVQNVEARQRLSKKLIKQQEASSKIKLGEIVEQKTKKLLQEPDVVACDMECQPVEVEVVEEYSVECCPVKVCCPIVENPVCCCPDMRVGNGFFGSAELLYWKFYEGGTEFAVDYNTNLAGDLAGAHSKKVTFDWESGFRVSAGYQFPQNGWDLYATYSQVLPHGSDSSSATAFPLLYYQGIFEATTAMAKANWNIHFRTLDVELAQKFCLTKSLSWRPHFGLKAAWINQHLHVTYSNLAHGVTSLAASMAVKEKNDFKGVGVQAGFDSQWKIGCGFSLFGKLSGALLVSEFELHQTQNFVPVASESFDQIDLKTHLHVLSPMAQVALGLEWERGIYCDTMLLHFNIGFESQYWWNQNRLERFTTIGDIFGVPNYIRVSEDLGLYGLTLGGGLDF